MRHLFLVALFLAFSSSAKAEDAGSEATLHLAAHVGVSYALDTMAQGVYERAFLMPPVTSEVFAAFTTIFVGTLYEVGENASGHDLARATWQNGLGIGAAVLTRLMFKWTF